MLQKKTCLFFIYKSIKYVLNQVLIRIMVGIFVILTENQVCLIGFVKVPRVMDESMLLVISLRHQVILK
jgi:hypothetical protein